MIRDISEGTKELKESQRQEGIIGNAIFSKAISLTFHQLFLSPLPSALPFPAPHPLSRFSLQSFFYPSSLLVVCFAEGQSGLYTAKDCSKAGARSTWIPLSARRKLL